jgi:hypothetical protein
MGKNKKWRIKMAAKKASVVKASKELMDLLVSSY